MAAGRSAWSGARGFARALLFVLACVPPQAGHAGTPGTGTLVVQVLDEGGFPLPYCAVTLVALHLGGVTDEAGLAMFKRLPPGDWVVIARYLGALPGSSVARVRAGAADSLSFTLRGTSAREIDGEIGAGQPAVWLRVCDRRGRPLAGADVVVPDVFDDHGTPRPAHLRTDEDGVAYLWPGMLCGARLGISISRSGYRTEIVAAGLAPALPESLQVTLQRRSARARTRP